MIEDIQTLKQLVPQDLILYLLVEKLDALGRISRDPDIWKNDFALSLMGYYLEEQLQSELSHRLARPVDLYLSPSFCRELLDFVRMLTTRRPEGQLAIYLDYLESWIEQNPLWIDEEPIAFERFEFS